MPIQHWFFSPRMPARGQMFWFAMAMCSVSCVLLVTVAPFFVWALMFTLNDGPFTPLVNYEIALVCSFLFYAHVAHAAWKFDRWGAVEIGLATVFATHGLLTGEGWLVLIGLIAVVRPVSHGPEPGGWGSGRPGKERLKGRNEL